MVKNMTGHVTQEDNVADNPPFSRLFRINFMLPKPVMICYKRLSMAKD